MSEQDTSDLTELQFHILEVMMDDAEDIEQIYLMANDSAFKMFPPQPRFPLRAIIDELRHMLEQDYIKAEFTNDETLAPLSKVVPAMLHHYWLSPTTKGLQAWEQHPKGTD
jgi:hypothetical protein